MPIIEEVYLERFVDVMTKHGFSREGARALFEYLEEYSESTGEPVNFDPIAFRCDFAEYGSEEEAKDDLGENGFVVVAEFNGGIIVAYT